MLGFGRITSTVSKNSVEAILAATTGRTLSDLAQEAVGVAKTQQSQAQGEVKAAQQQMAVAQQQLSQATQKLGAANQLMAAANSLAGK